MALQTAVLNAAADGAVALLAWASLHTADPGGTGASEVTGGSPAYARQQVTWDPATGAVAAISGTESFDIPAGTTVTHAGVWSASSGGTWRGGTALSASETFTGQGVYELTALTVTAASG